jgi:hypothetical protein
MPTAEPWGQYYPVGQMPITEPESVGVFDVAPDFE